MPQSKRPKYGCASDILFHFGEEDCSLEEGDFGEAMRLVISESYQERGTVPMDSEDKHDRMFHESLDAMHSCANECAAIWERNAHDTEKTLAEIKQRVTKERDSANTIVADTFEWFASALESGDYNTLAI